MVDGRDVSRGSVLPAQRHSGADSVAPGAAGRHPAARAAFSRPAVGRGHAAARPGDGVAGRPAGADGRSRGPATCANSKTSWSARSRLSPGRAQITLAGSAGGNPAGGRRPHEHRAARSPTKGIEMERLVSDFERSLIAGLWNEQQATSARPPTCCTSSGRRSSKSSSAWNDIVARARRKGHRVESMNLAAFSSCLIEATMASVSAFHPLPSALSPMPFKCLATSSG